MCFDCVTEHKCQVAYHENLRQDFLHESRDTKSQAKQNLTGTFQTQEHQGNELTSFRSNVDSLSTYVFGSFQRDVNRATAN